MAIKISEITYEPYGNCIKIENDVVDVVVTVDFGPRIIRYGFIGEKNVFCEAPENTQEKTGWKIYGGHRLWHSPENMPRTYEADNHSVKWELCDDGVHVIQSPESWSMMSKEMIISLAPESSHVHILHRITNMGAWCVKLAAWAITVMAPGGKEIIPTPISDTELLPNRWLALWPYTRMTDPRVWWGDDYITLQQDPSCKEKFKFGVNGEDGWAAYFNHGTCFVKKYMPEKDANYPDNGMTYETFTTDFMLEMESLSPLFDVEPGDTIQHQEAWQLTANIDAPDNDDEAIDAVMRHIFGGCGDDCGCGHDHHGNDSCDCGHDHHHHEGDNCDCEK
jgi:hypothetical protein